LSRSINQSKKKQAEILLIGSDQLRNHHLFDGSRAILDEVNVATGDDANLSTVQLSVDSDRECH